MDESVSKRLSPRALRGLEARDPPDYPARYDFRAGWPGADTFPVAGLRAALEQVLAQEAGAALQYGSFSGYDALRDAVARRVGAEDGTRIERAQVTLTAGSTHALALVCEAYLREGDTVITESLTWPIMLRALRLYGLRVETAPVDAQGLDVEALAQVLARLEQEGRRARLLYTIPNFHNPTGTVLSGERRKRLMALAERHDLPVLEDDIYGPVRFAGALERSLLSLDRKGLVVKTGGFSKLLAPGLRLGWAIGHPDVIAVLDALRSDLGVSQLLARAAWRFMESGEMEHHAAEVVGVYRKKRDRMLAAIGEHCAPWLRPNRPDGGLYLWAALAPNVDPQRLLQEAEREGVAYRWGRNYSVDGSASQFIRLGYSQRTLEEIEAGMAALGRALVRSARQAGG